MKAIGKLRQHGLLRGRSNGEAAAAPAKHHSRGGTPVTIATFHMAISCPLSRDSLPLLVGSALDVVTRTDRDTAIGTILR